MEFISSIKNTLSQHPGLAEAYNGDLMKIIPYFGLPPVDTTSEFDKMPKSTLSLAQLYDKKSNPYVTHVIYTNFHLLSNSWHYALCPLKLENALVQEYRVRYREISPLDLSPELSAPRVTEYTEKECKVYTSRFSKGFSTTNDFFKTEEGKRDFDEAMHTIAYGAFLTGKLCVVRAITSAETLTIYNIPSAPFGSVSARDIYLNEIRFFGAINTREKVIYLLDAEAKRALSASEMSTRPNVAIFCDGDLAFIAYNNQFETEAYRRGDRTASRHLMEGGEAMRLNGLEIYEDYRYNMKSLGVMDKPGLERNVNVGRAFTVSCHEYMNTPGFDSSRALSFMYYNSKKNDYAIFEASDLLDKCCRFDGDGRLSSYHGELCNSFNSWSSTNQMPPFGDDELVDHYLYKVDGHAGYPRYAVCEVVGDMEKSYLTDDFIRFFGSDFKTKLLQELGEETCRQLGEILTVSSLLYSPATVSDKLENFLAAVMLMPGTAPADETAIWVNHLDGAPQLPYRDPKSGYLYVENPELELSSGQEADYLLKYSLSPVVAVKQGDKTIAYRVFLPPSNPGDWMPVSNGIDKRFTKMKVVKEDGSLEVADIESGGYAYEHCGSIDKPLGYGDLSGISYLAKLHRSGDTRGWDPLLMERASNAFRGFETYFTAARQKFPDNMGFDPRNCPVHLFTGQDDVDSQNAHFHNDFLMSEHYGIFGRRPLKDSNGFTLSVRGKQAESDASVRSQVSNAVRVLQGMGYGEEELLGNEGYARALLLIAIMNVTKLQLVKDLRPYNEGGKIFKDYEGSDLAKAIATHLPDASRNFSFLFENYVFSWYRDNYRGKEEKETPGKTLGMCRNLFQNALNEFVNSSVNISQSSQLSSKRAMDNFLENLRTSNAAKILPAIEFYEEELRRYLADPAGYSVRDERSPAEAAAPYPVQYHCMRLSLDPEGYRTLGVQALSNRAAREKIYSLVAWPSNPENPLTPVHHWTHSAPESAPLNSVGESFTMAGSKGRKSVQPSDRRAPGKKPVPFYDAIRNFPNAPRSKRAQQQHQRRYQAGPLPSYPQSRETDGSGGGEMAGAHKRKRPAEEAVWTKAAFAGRSFRDSRSSSYRPRGGINPERLGPDGDLALTYEEEEEDQAFSGSLDTKFDVDSNKILVRENLINNLLFSMHMSKDLIARLGAQLFCQSVITKAQYKVWLAEGLPIPESFTYAEPWVCLNMGSAVWTEKNIGSTGCGFEDTGLQANVTNKQWTAHYTCYISSHIFADKKIFWADDVSYRGLVHGMGGDVFTEQSGPEGFRPKSCGTVFSKATGFVFSHGPSMRADGLPKPFWTLTGKQDKRYRDSITPPDHYRWPGDIFYNFLWGFQDLNSRGAITVDNSSFITRSSSQYVNVVLSQGRQKNWNPLTGYYGGKDRTTKGTGHLGNWEAKNVLRVLNGQDMGCERDDE